MKLFDQSFYSKTSKIAFFVVLFLLFTVWISTERFLQFDFALMGYFISSIIFAIGLTIRMSAWLVRPATQQVIKRSMGNLKNRERKKRNIRSILKTAFDNIILQKFIFKRGVYRGVQHILIAWGCIGSFIITFGLTFGWMRFDMVNSQTYALVLFGFKTFQMNADGLFAELVYNGLNITAIMVLIGVCMALARRIKNEDVKVTQRAEFDLFPLYLLLSVTVTGLLLTVSYALLDGYMHHYLTLIHQVTVVILLIYFPFGKLFHFPVRPLATAVPLNYQEEWKIDTKPCKRCNTPYSSDDQVLDVQAILKEQKIDLQLSDGSFLSDYCPSCRRRIRVLKQLNMEDGSEEKLNPISTMNGIHLSGFSAERRDEYYDFSDEVKEQIDKYKQVGGEKQ
ncbi:MFS transporter [Bacillus carboniphilus]|uniref:MFS transporter n=1 Tax=Bacillus carboniphilus TaxID=86663 RepID=A0ABY9JUE9_9BACI|nr:MFS transporter [Bacillus carboniphilus]WLR42368.1 MFS transporter [Bacillus carboniphilus]